MTKTPGQPEFFIDLPDEKAPKFPPRVFVSHRLGIPRCYLIASRTKPSVEYVSLPEAEALVREAEARVYEECWTFLMLQSDPAMLQTSIWLQDKMKESRSKAGEGEA